MRAEPVGRLQLESRAAPLLLVGGDPAPPHGMDGLQLHQPGQDAAKLRVALLAAVDARLAVMPVAASSADPRLGRGHIARIRSDAGRHLNAGDLVALTLV